MKILNSTFHTWWHEQQTFAEFIVISVTNGRTPRGDTVRILT